MPCQILSARFRFSAEFRYVHGQSKLAESERWDRFVALNDTARQAIVDIVIGEKKLLRRQFNEAGLDGAIIRKVILQSAALKKALFEKPVTGS
jgi:hypothetical protein